MASGKVSNKQQRKGVRPNGRYHSSLEQGSLIGAINSFNEDGLAFISSLIESRRNKLGIQAYPPVQGQVHDDQNKAEVSQQPKKKKKIPVWEWTVLKDIAFVVEWGRRSSVERAADSDTSRIVSILSGFVSRFKSADCSDKQIVSLANHAQGKPFLFKALTPELLENGNTRKGVPTWEGEEGSSELFASMATWWSEPDNSGTFSLDKSEESDTGDSVEPVVEDSGGDQHLSTATPSSARVREKKRGRSAAKAKPLKRGKSEGRATDDT